MLLQQMYLSTRILRHAAKQCKLNPHLLIRSTASIMTCMPMCDYGLTAHQAKNPPLGQHQHTLSILHAKQKGNQQNHKVLSHQMQVKELDY